MTYSKGPWSTHGNHVYSGNNSVCSVPAYNGKVHKPMDLRIVSNGLRLLEALKDVGCTCSYGIGHPSVSKHSDACQKVLDLVREVEDGPEDLTPKVIEYVKAEVNAHMEARYGWSTMRDYQALIDFKDLNSVWKQSDKNALWLHWEDEGVPVWDPIAIEYIWVGYVTSDEMVYDDPNVAALADQVKGGVPWGEVFIFKDIENDVILARTAKHLFGEPGGVISRSISATTFVSNELQSIVLLNRGLTVSEVANLEHGVHTPIDMSEVNQSVKSFKP